jgi:hypothetical protein
LKVQRQEAALEREIAVRSELIALLSEFGKALEDKQDIDFDELDRKIAIQIQRWRMNLDATVDDELRSQLQGWCGLFSDTVLNVSRKDMFSDGQLSIRRALGALQQAAINYRDTTRGQTWDSEGTAEYLDEAWQVVFRFNANYYSGHKDNMFAPATPEERRFPQWLIDQTDARKAEQG